MLQKGCQKTSDIDGLEHKPRLREIVWVIAQTKSLSAREKVAENETLTSSVKWHLNGARAERRCSLTVDSIRGFVASFLEPFLTSGQL